MIFSRLVIITSLLLMTDSLFAAEAPSQAVDDTTLTVTVGASSKKAVFIITDKDSGNDQATLTGSNVAPVIKIATGDLLDNPNSKWRIVLEAGYSDFSTDRQQVDGKDVDYGTSIDGKYYYVMPVVYYSEVEKGGDFSSARGLLFGIGIGLVGLQATGTAVYTKSNSLQKHAIDVNGTGMILTTYLGYQIGGLELTANLIGIGVDNSKQDSNRYALGEFGIMASYKLYF